MQSAWDKWFSSKLEHMTDAVFWQCNWVCEYRNCAEQINGKYSEYIAECERCAVLVTEAICVQCSKYTSIPGIYGTSSGWENSASLWMNKTFNQFKNTGMQYLIFRSFFKKDKSLRNWAVEVMEVWRTSLRTPLPERFSNPLPSRHLACVISGFPLDLGDVFLIPFQKSSGNSSHAYWGSWWVFNFFPTSCRMADNIRIFQNILWKYCASASSLGTTQKVKCYVL